MDSGLIPILILAAGALLLATGLLAAGSLLGPGRTGAVKQMPYESGMDPIHDTRRRFDVRFHLVAITFLIFDVELLFLYPWAVANKSPEGFARVAAGLAAEMGGSAAEVGGSAAEVGGSAAVGFSSTLVFFEVMFFIAMLALGFVYAWRKGVFRWR